MFNLVNVKISKSIITLASKNSNLKVFSQNCFALINLALRPT